MANDENSLNRDPLSNEPGSHPIGTGIGATGGAVTGAALGLAGGPIGVVLGTVVGAVVGGLAGKGAAEAVNPTAEDAYWRGAYEDEPYRAEGRGYDDYAPAYRAGYEGWGASKTDFDAYDQEMRTQWDSRRGDSRLSWEEARPASRAAWERAQRQYPMDI